MSEEQADRSIKYRGQLAGVAAQGLLETLMSDGPDLVNTHFPDNPRLVRPNVRIAKRKPGGPSQLYLNDERVVYPIVYDSISVQRRGGMNILTLFIVVGDVDMDSKPLPDDGA